MKSRFDRALRWYPLEWRDRYGDEFVLLLKDSFPHSLPTRVRMSLSMNGVREHLHSLGVVGQAAPRQDRVKGGALVVLTGWTFFVVAGTLFAKFAEQWSTATPVGQQSWPTVGYNIVLAGGIVGSAVLAVAALSVLPATMRLLRAGGWELVRRTSFRASVALVLFLGMLGSLIAVAHGLSSVQRNGGSPGYERFALVVGVVGLLALTLGTAAIVTVVRRLTFSRLILRLLSALVGALGTVMTAVLTGTAIFWVTEAQHAGRFMKGEGGGYVGLVSSTFPPTLDLAGLLMVVGLLLAGTGLARVHSARPFAASEVTN